MHTCVIKPSVTLNDCEDFGCMVFSKRYNPCCLVCVCVCVCLCVCVCVCVVSISIYGSLGGWFSSTSNGHYTPGTGTIMLQYSFISYLFCSLPPTFYLSLLLY